MALEDRLFNKLERLARRYNESIVASVEAYKVESTNTETTAEDLIAKLEPWDRKRRMTLQEIFESANRCWMSS